MTVLQFSYMFEVFKLWIQNMLKSKKKFLIVCVKATNIGRNW